MNPHYLEVADRARHYCEYCRAPESSFNFPFDVEHILPPKHGGLNLESNLALACRSCNIYKGDRIEAVDDQTSSLSRLYNPRIDYWFDHFRYDIASGSIFGLTRIGRATTSALHMNSELQKSARRNWTRVGLYP